LLSLGATNGARPGMPGPKHGDSSGKRPRRRRLLRREVLAPPLPSTTTDGSSAAAPAGVASGGRSGNQGRSPALGMGALEAEDAARSGSPSATPQAGESAKTPTPRHCPPAAAVSQTRGPGAHPLVPGVSGPEAAVRVSQGTCNIAGSAESGDVGQQAPARASAAGRQVAPHRAPLRCESSDVSASAGGASGRAASSVAAGSASMLRRNQSPSPAATAAVGGEFAASSSRAGGHPSSPPAAAPCAPLTRSTLARPAAGCIRVPHVAGVARSSERAPAKALLTSSSSMARDRVLPGSTRTRPLIESSHPGSTASNWLRSDTTATKGPSGAATSKGPSDTTTAKEHSDGTTAKGPSDTTTAKEHSDGTTAKEHSDGTAALDRAEAETVEALQARVAVPPWAPGGWAAPGFGSLRESSGGDRNSFAPLFGVGAEPTPGSRGLNVPLLTSWVVTGSAPDFDRTRAGRARARGQAGAAAAQCGNPGAQQQPLALGRQAGGAPSGLRLVAQLTGLPAIGRRSDAAELRHGVWLSLGPSELSAEPLEVQARQLRALLAQERQESAALARRSMAGLRDVQALSSLQRPGKRERSAGGGNVAEPQSKRLLH